MLYVGGFEDDLVSVLDFDARGGTRRALTSMSGTGQPSFRHWKMSRFVAAYCNSVRPKDLQYAFEEHVVTRKI